MLVRDMTIEASDVSGERVVTATGAADATVGELVLSLLAEMNLPRNDVEGRPLTYHARLERDGRHLHASETVGESLQEHDRIVLQPHITAG